MSNQYEDAVAKPIHDYWREPSARDLALLHREWGVQRPAPYEGVIPADGPRSAAEVARNCSASHEGEWLVVSREVYATRWTAAS